MILYQLTGLYCYHLVLVVDVWVGELIEILFAFAGVQPDGKSGCPAILSKKKNKTE